MVVDLCGQPLTRLKPVKLICAVVDAAENTGMVAYQRFISGEFSRTERGAGRRTDHRPINPERRRVVRLEAAPLEPDN